MSSGGVFQIVTNDGKADKMLLASDLLEERIRDIRQDNKQRVIAAGGDPSKEDLDPTLSEISQTHLIHFQSRFKPFVAVAMEYSKIIPQSGGGQFGSTVIFSLPQFGDFFADMALNIQLSSASAAPAALPVLPANPAAIVAANNQVDGTATLLDGSVLHQIDPAAQMIRTFEYLGYIKYDGTLADAGDLVADNVYYCDFPGERMFVKIDFQVNGNPLDDFGTFSYVFQRQFKLKADKKVGYYRNVGQELPIESKSLNIGDGVRYGGQVFTGLQTPAQTQPAFQIWQKLLFWFNQDASNAIPSAAIPYGQRYINVQLGVVSDLLFRAPAIYNILKVTNLYYPAAQFIKNPDGTYNFTAGFGALQNTFYQYQYLPVYTNGALNYPTITAMQLYANNIFTHPMIHDLYIKRIGFSLVRVHRRQQQTINQPDVNMLMNSFKFPVEYIYLGVLPDVNTTGQWQATDWCQFASISHKFTSNGIYLTTEANKLFDSSVFHWQERTRTVDSMEVTAHGMNLYQKIDSQFYNSYKPMVFGEHTLVTPADDGALLVNFALYPAVHQPSGHINISRAREFYIHVYSSVIGSIGSTGQTVTGQLITEATALNFLLISDGSAILRYST